MQNRILSKEIPIYRKKLADEQLGLCPLCLTVLTGKVCLDHNHANGKLRATLHDSCNYALGRVEGAAKRTPNPVQWIKNLSLYLDAHRTNPRPEFHPSWLTQEEKRAKGNKRAKLRYMKSLSPEGKKKLRKRRQKIKLAYDSRPV